MNRAFGFGTRFKKYLREAKDRLLTIAQTESPEAVASAEAVAAIEGVDVLFIGPMDLSHSMGIVGEFENPRLQEAFRVAARGRELAWKSCGDSAA